MKRSFPLFIIDSSRAHGRARETDFIACTSRENPFVAEVTLLNPQELAIDQDWRDKSPLCLYTEDRGFGIRAKLKVVDGNPDPSLMRRALKEWQVRRAATPVNLEDISDEAIVSFVEALLEQARENLRENPKDGQAYMVSRILQKIKRDYESENQE